MSLIEAFAAYIEKRKAEKLSRHEPFVGQKQQKIRSVVSFGRFFGQEVDENKLRNDPDLLSRTPGELTNRNRR